MTSGEKIWNIIQNKGAIPGTWRNYRYLTTSFTDEPVFIVVNEVLWYAVRIIIFDKPQKWGWGNLQVYKVSEHLTLSGAKEKAEELERKIKNLESDYQFPILSVLNNVYLDSELDDEIEKTLSQNTWRHFPIISVSEADDYLRPFDVIKVSRIGGFFSHWGIYLGNGYVCDFSGNKMGSSASGSFKVEKRTLREFFDGDETSHMGIVRPLVKFKNNEKMIESIVKVIITEYGKYEYNTTKNNCEHFANMIVYEINYSEQGNGLKPFSSCNTSLKREIKECDRYLNNLTYSSYQSENLTKEIKRITKTHETTNAYGDWEARIEVRDVGWKNEWCKIQ